MATTTSKITSCPKCMFPMKVKFVMDEQDSKWKLAFFYDQSQAVPVQLTHCPGCGFDLSEMAQNLKKS